MLHNSNAVALIKMNRLCHNTLMNLFDLLLVRNRLSHHNKKEIISIYAYTETIVRLIQFLLKQKRKHKFFNTLCTFRDLIIVVISNVFL